MPELPDLVYIEKKLSDFASGKKIVTVIIKEPVVIRVLTEEPFEQALVKKRFKEVYRHGPFLGFRFHEKIELVLHPMLAGRLKISSNEKKPGRDLCFSLKMDDGTFLSYLDNKKMGKVYLIRPGDYQNIPRFLNQGVNLIDQEFTLEKFQSLIKKQRKQVRVFLMDQTQLSAIGNAYADEILFDAGIHPKTFCYQLDQSDIKQLFESIIKVINWGITEVEKAQQPIDVKVRDHVKVRNRRNLPCPECGTTIRRTGVLGYDSFFCPQCQPSKREQFINW